MNAKRAAWEESRRYLETEKKRGEAAIAPYTEKAREHGWLAGWLGGVSV